MDKISFVLAAMINGFLTVGIPFILNELTLQLTGGWQLLFLLIFQSLILLIIVILAEGGTNNE